MKTSQVKRAPGFERMKVIDVHPDQPDILTHFYFIIDVKKWTNSIISYILLFFKVIGMNSININLLTRIKNFSEIPQFFTGWLVPFKGRVDCYPGCGCR